MGPAAPRGQGAPKSDSLLGLAGALIAFVEGATVIIFRAHYTMDVLAAIAASWCAFSLSVWLQGPG